MLIDQWKNKKSSAPKTATKALKRLSQFSGKHLDRMANTMHKEVFGKIDCLDCANCCTSIPPIVNKTDSARIAKHLGLSLSDFHSQYLIDDEDGDTVMATVPCVFLEEDNKCRIYDVRPKACREYPHTDESTFSSNMDLHKNNALHCPAVFHILQEMSKRIP